ncbi:MAG: hypothetical protein AAF430_05390 [Myxococcota bacterium]
MKNRSTYKRHSIAANAAGEEIARSLGCGASWRTPHAGRFAPALVGPFALVDPK